MYFSLNFHGVYSPHIYVQSDVIVVHFIYLTNCRTAVVTALSQCLTLRISISVLNQCLLNYDISLTLELRTRQERRV